MAQQVREIGDLLGELSGDIQRLVRDEIRLARVELTQNVRQAAVGLAGLAVAAAMAYLGVVFVGVAVFFAIFLAIPGWAAGLAVAAGYFIIAALAFIVGRQRLRPSQILPEQTIESLEEDREWLERRVR
jgi:uncharacterized membrane protein YqjE